MNPAIETKELMYVYGFIPTAEADARPLQSFKGLDDEHLTYTKSFGEITAVMCKLDEKEYGEAELEAKMENGEWLRDKAFHHHDALVKVNEQYTVIPLKFCTIFKNENNLNEVIQNQKDTVLALFSSLQNKEEWNVKIYCSEEAVKENVLLSSPELEEKKKEIEQLPSGRQFFERKKLQKFADELLEKEIDKRSRMIHDKLSSLSSKSAIKKNLSKEVTGRNDVMAWNSVYLIEKDHVQGLLEEIKTMQTAKENEAYTIEATGPWPTYYFANL